MNALERLFTCVSCSALGAITFFPNVMMNDSGKYPGAAGMGMLASASFVSAGISALVLPQFTLGLFGTGIILQGSALVAAAKN